LAVVLPAYTSHLDDGVGIQKLVSALNYLSATKYLPAEEQAKVHELVVVLSSKQLAHS
jgi:hypothetical protein